MKNRIHRTFSVLLFVTVSIFDSSCKKSAAPEFSTISVVGKWRYQKEHYVIIENGKKTMDTFTSYQQTWNLFEFKPDHTKIETSEYIPRIKVKNYTVDGILLTETAGINTLPEVDTFIVPQGLYHYYISLYNDTLILNDSSIFNLDGKTEVRRSIKTYYSKY